MDRPMAWSRRLLHPQSCLVVRALVREAAVVAAMIVYPEGMGALRRDDTGEHEHENRQERMHRYGVPLSKNSFCSSCHHHPFFWKSCQLGPEAHKLISAFMCESNENEA